jgi:glycosyltransferase involved in cell wall biosynthesis
MPRRIALVTQGYQSAGGVQTVARWLVDGLRRNDYAVNVFDLASSARDPWSRRLTAPLSMVRRSLIARDADEPDVTHVGANAVEIESFRYHPRAELTAILDQFDVVQIVAGGPALAGVTANTSTPCALQVATTVAWEREAMLRGSWSPTRVWRRLMTHRVGMTERSILRAADAVLVENDLMADFARGAGQESVVLAPPGVDTRTFTPHPAGWQSEGYLLSVCRLADERKGLGRLIEGYAIAVRADPTLPRLVLAGRGALPDAHEELIDRLDVRSRVTVRSDVPAEELPALYRSASVYLQASFEEGLGISVLEAMASGLPVVATDTAGTRVTVVDGSTGVLVPQHDVARRLADGTALTRESGTAMAENARERAVTSFSTEATLARYLEVYDALIDGRHRVSVP